MAKISFELPLKTVSEANSSEHWAVKSKRHKQQQFFIRAVMKKYNKITLPCSICMTRLSPRMLDDDNLRTCFKYIRDEISEVLIPEKTGSYINKNGKVVSIKGRSDSDQRISWHYSQEKCPVQGIRIEIEFSSDH